jgi:shikimate kinase/3-dehydroquinate synthase
MRPIVLSGFMATGKTSVGRRLAARLQLPFVDTDEELERAAGKRIADLWREEGEASFRQREVDLVERLFAEAGPRVIAYGGGTVTSRRARHLALERATTISLTAAPETAVARASASGTERPNLAVGGDPIARARELLEARAQAYAEAHATLATDGADMEALVDAIIAVVARDPIVVPLGTRSYIVDVVNDSPATLTDAIAGAAPSSLIVVTDAHVQRDRHEHVAAALGALAIPQTTVTLPAGERHKTIASVATIWDAALGAGVDREALVVGLGGGVVGDLAGFAAASLLRGVRSLLVPTTLLAMVDASVGGKTGFDHPVGKNLIGAFHQPTAVVVDLAHLATLPARERNAGLAEMVKVALTSDAELFAELERNAAAAARGDADVLLPMIRRALEAKVRIVRDDERETGSRALLNLGHTIGHALEAHGGYRTLLHGEAVALGTVAELAAAARLGLTPQPLVQRTQRLLTRLGLPASPSRGEVGASWSFVGSDKKRLAARIRLPVVSAPGESRVESVALEAFRTAALGALD